MSTKKKQKLTDLAQTLKNQAPAALTYLLGALLVWLFGVLVFLPLANSMNRQTEILCSLIVFISFTAFMCKAASGCKKLIDAFSVLFARSYGKKWVIPSGEALAVFKNAFYIIAGFVTYALYLPLLINFHPAIAGIVLILVVIWSFFLLLRIAPVLFSRFLHRLT